MEEHRDTWFFDGNRLYAPKNLVGKIKKTSWKATSGGRPAGDDAYKGNYIIAVRLRGNKKVQNLNDMWYEEVAQTLATQGDFGLESP